MVQVFMNQQHVQLRWVGGTHAVHRCTPPRHASVHPRAACVISPLLSDCKRFHPRCRSSVQCAASEARRPQPTAAQNTAFSVVALGNICLDIVYPTDLIPELDAPEQKREVLQRLNATTHPASNWEVGGNCNFAIAAARLGLEVDVVGHWGTESYGDFVAEVLHAENARGLHRVSSELNVEDVAHTLVCYVMVNPESKHAFVSKYDLGPAPLFGGLQQLPGPARQALLNARAIFTNAFVFDEVPFPVVLETTRQAVHKGSAFFFDPGPRCFSMMADESRRQVLECMLDLADVVLMTQEEAECVTGLSKPADMCRWLLERPQGRLQWVVIKLGPQGAMVATREDTTNPYLAPPIRVEVQDTVGCGDSFAAGVVLGYLAGCDLACTLMLANAVGAATAMGRGAGRNVADADRVVQLLQRTIGNSNDKVRLAASRAVGVVQARQRSSRVLQ